MGDPQDRSRREMLKSLGLGLGGLALPGCVAREAGEAEGERELAEQTRRKPPVHPNIVLILVDDLGWGDLSSYGAADLRTPHVDALVSSGMRFDRFYANCPVCSPTRASVLTGRFPDLVGVPGVIRTHAANNWGHLSADAVMLPEVLARAGYDTAAVGKWHLGLGQSGKGRNTPNARGFGHFHGFLGDMMDDYYKHRRHGINYMRLNEEEIDPPGHATDLFSQWAADYIRGRAGPAEKETPFFLYLAYNAPHTPIQPPREWVERVREREKDMARKRVSLAALIEHMDDGIGRVMAALDETGLRDDTLVIFASDNGGQLGVGARNGPLRAGKGDMYEGGIRVPMCASWPGRIAGGPASDLVAMTMDLFPTVCEAAGASFDHEIEGRSLLPTLLGRTSDPAGFADRLLVWVRREGGRRYRGKAYYAARRGDWKLLQNSPSSPFELFNLRDDPKEERPLGRDHPRYAPLHDALQAHVRRASAVPWRRP